eukprot:363306-Chlamydomonas_euryale.AAC.5
MDEKWSTLEALGRSPSAAFRWSLSRPACRRTTPPSAGAGPLPSAHDGSPGAQICAARRARSAGFGMCGGGAGRLQNVLRLSEKLSGNLDGCVDGRMDEWMGEWMA